MCNVIKISLILKKFQFRIFLISMTSWEIKLARVSSPHKIGKKNENKKFIHKCTSKNEN